MNGGNINSRSLVDIRRVTHELFFHSYNAVRHHTHPDVSHSESGSYQCNKISRYGSLFEEAIRGGVLSLGVLGYFLVHCLVFTFFLLEEK